MSLADQDLAAAAAALADEAGLSLAPGLEPRLRGAIQAAAAERGERPEALAARVAARDAGAVADLLEHAVVGETAFFRHPEQLDALARRLAGAPPASLWCVGCSTGEEPWSLAITLALAGREADRILATDVSVRSLEVARAGRYPARALRKLPPAAEPFLGPADAEGRRAILPALRARVTFERHNLVRDPPPRGAPFDGILCRNVLIYFEPAAAAAAVSRLGAALAPAGLLALGPVEQPLATPLPFEWLEEPRATLLRRGGPAGSPFGPP